MQTSSCLPRVSFVLVAAVVALAACSDATTDLPSAAPSSSGGGEDDGLIPGPDVDLDHPPSPDTNDEDGVDGSPAALGGQDGGVAAGDAGASTTTLCKKKLTIIFTVGVPGKSKIASNGCWTPIITDGAAVNSYRKCSTGAFAVTNNPNAPNWAYDDTNPQHSLTQEKTFLAQCANGSTGDGYEFMAYRSGWRMLGATHLRAYFAELYGSATTDIDSLYGISAVYKNNVGLKNKINVSVWPMINFGPPASSNLHAKVGAEILKICKTLPTNGYFGMYNATWPDGMAANDKRLVALENALNACTAL